MEFLDRIATLLYINVENSESPSAKPADGPISINGDTDSELQDFDEDTTVNLLDETPPTIVNDSDSYGVETFSNSVVYNCPSIPTNGFVSKQVRMTAPHVFSKIFKYASPAMCVEKTNLTNAYRLLIDTADREIGDTHVTMEKIYGNKLKFTTHIGLTYYQKHNAKLNVDHWTVTVKKRDDRVYENEHSHGVHHEHTLYEFYDDTNKVVAMAVPLKAFNNTQKQRVDVKTEISCEIIKYRSPWLPVEENIVTDAFELIFPKMMMSKTKPASFKKWMLILIGQSHVTVKDMYRLIPATRRALKNEEELEIVKKRYAIWEKIDGKMKQVPKNTFFLNDEIINVFIALLHNDGLQRASKQFISHPNVYVCPTFWYRRYVRAQDIPGLARVAVPERIGYSIMDCDTILVPVNRPHVHWYLVSIKLKFPHEILVYDSSSNSFVLEEIKRVFQLFQNILEVFSPKSESPKFMLDHVSMADSPTQGTDHDCGVYMCMNIEMLSRGYVVPKNLLDVDGNDICIARLRDYMIYTLITHA
jgi:hypothetical protein